jgi:Ca2+-dependent lipid-binding protein
MCGRLTRDTESMGSMDPYLKLTIGARQERSRVHPDGGKFPQWNDEFNFAITTEDIVKFEVWDRNHVSSDSMVGEGAISIATVKERRDFEDWFDITFKGKASGSVRLGFKYTPDAATK